MISIEFLPFFPRIPTYDDELEKVDAAKKGMEDKQAIMDLREQAFQHCMKNIRGGYYKYEDYVYCKPYVEDETAKFIEENNLAPQQPSSDEIIKVESAERPADEPDAHTYEFYDEDWDENEADFLDDEKHLKLQVGFWERLWNRLLDGESPWSTTQTE